MREERLVLRQDTVDRTAVCCHLSRCCDISSDVVGCEVCAHAVARFPATGILANCHDLSSHIRTGDEVFGKAKGALW